MSESNRKNRHDPVVAQEEQGVRGRPLIAILASAVGVGVVAVIGSDWLLRSVFGFEQERQQQRPAEPPALETSRMRDSARGLDMHEAAHQRMKEFGWVDRKKGVVSIPIQKAMEAVVLQSTVAFGAGGVPASGEEDNP